MATHNQSTRKRNIVNLNNSSYPDRKRYKMGNCSTHQPTNIQIAYINAHNKLIENMSQLPLILHNKNTNNNGHNNNGHNSKPNISTTPLCPPIPLPPIFLLNNNKPIQPKKPPIPTENINAFADSDDDDDDIRIYAIKKPINTQQVSVPIAQKQVQLPTHWDGYNDYNINNNCVIDDGFLDYDYKSTTDSLTSLTSLTSASDPLFELNQSNHSCNII